MYISQMSSLEVLKMINNHEITDVGIKYLMSLQTLRQIGIYGCHKLTRLSISYLDTMPLLSYVSANNKLMFVDGNLSWRWGSVYPRYIDDLPKYRSI